MGPDFEGGIGVYSVIPDGISYALATYFRV